MNSDERLAYKEFRKDGWPYCPRCGDDELYSHLMLRWTKSEPPTVEQCLAAGTQCYRCGWKSSGMNHFGNKCFRCGLVFTTLRTEPDYVNCCNCRIEIREESERNRIKQEVERMGWPEEIA